MLARRCWALARAALVLTLGLGATACFDTPRPSCAFLCGTDLSCPSGYACASDGWCKLDGLGDGFVCDGVAIDARPIDAPVADAPIGDAPLEDATEADATEIDATEIDATEIDATEVDAATDAPIDASVAATLVITTPGPLAFGAVIQTQSQTRIVTVRNDGDVPTSALTVSVSGATPFALLDDGSNTCAGTVLAGHSACTVSVRFTPATVGTFTATLSATATTGGTATLAMTGDSTASLVVSTMPVFDPVMVGMTGTQVITFRNAGATATGTITTVAPTNPTFTITADTCNAASVAPNATCAVTVRFTPTATGPQSSSVRLNATPGGPRTIALSATGA